MNLDFFIYDDTLITVNPDIEKDRGFNQKIYQY